MVCRTKGCARQMRAFRPTGPRRRGNQAAPYRTLCQIRDWGGCASKRPHPGASYGAGTVAPCAKSGTLAQRLAEGRTLEPLLVQDMHPCQVPRHGYLSA